MLLLGVVIVQPVQSYVFILTSINCLNIKCKFCRKEKRDLTMRILKSMEIQFLRILPKVQKMQASIIQISVIFLVQCFSVILQALCLFPFPLKHLTFANAKTFGTVFDQKIGEKMEKD